MFVLCITIAFFQHVAAEHLSPVQRHEPYTLLLPDKLLGLYAFDKGLDNFMPFDNPVRYVCNRPCRQKRDGNVPLCLCVRVCACLRL